MMSIGTERITDLRNSLVMRGKGRVMQRCSDVVKTERLFEIRSMELNKQ